MRYAIISDLHANWQAWNAVTLDAESIGIDAFICLGDIVGYGPSPVDTLSSVTDYVQHFVAGNHDAAVAGALDPGCFNTEAQHSVSWTCAQLDGDRLRFLENLPLVLQGSYFRCVHANAAQPQLFDYIFDAEQANTSWNRIHDQVLFIGHTHLPEIFVMGSSGTPHQLPPQDFQIEKGKRYIVNVGSVGLPRDGDRRASYCIFDEESGSIWFRRIPFDLSAYFALFRQENAPVQNPGFLEPLRPEYQNGTIAPRMDFNPPATDSSNLQAREVLSIKDGDTVPHRKAFKWKVAAVLCAVVAVSLATWIFSASSKESQGLYIPSEYNHQSRTFSVPDVGDYLALETPAKESVAEDSPFKLWSVQMDKPEKQLVSGRFDSANKKTEDDPQDVMRMKSEDMGRMLLLSPVFTAPAGTRLQIKGSFKQRAWKEGFIKLVLFKKLPDETRVTVMDTTPSGLSSSDHWCFTSQTMREAFREKYNVQVAILGKFTGDVLVRRLRLRRREQL